MARTITASLHPATAALQVVQTRHAYGATLAPRLDLRSRAPQNGRQLPRRSSRTTPPTVQGNLTPDTTATPSDGNARPALIERYTQTTDEEWNARAQAPHGQTTDGEWSELVQATTEIDTSLPIDRAEFERLAEEWLEQRPRGVDVAQMIRHPAYQSIIDIGAEAVPWLLERLAQSPDHWFYALNQITDAQPVQPEHQGNINAMAEEWIAWGKQNQP